MSTGNKLLARYTQIREEALAHINDRKRTADLGIVCMPAERWAVVVADRSLAIRKTPEGFRLKSVSGDLCGTNLFTKAGAERVAELWNASGDLDTVEVILDNDLVDARLADVERQIAYIKTLLPGSAVVVRDADFR